MKQLPVNSQYEHAPIMTCSFSAMKAARRHPVNKTSTARNSHGRGALLVTAAIFLISISFNTVLAHPAPISGAERTLHLALHSEVLEESRVFRVRLPAAYDQSPDERLPVFYVTDADWNFELVAGTLDYLARWGRIPAFIVVGAMNVSRNRDFLPREDAAFPSSGGGDRYLEHIEQELIPWIDERFRTSEERVLFGHSFGGVLVINQLLANPTAFDAYIALGTSFWVADEVLLERAENVLERGPALEGWLYLSVGEGDGGATVPAGRQFADLLEFHAPAALDWTHTVMPEETHFTNVPISLHHALSKLFPTWGDDQSLFEAGESGDSEAVERWFAERRNQLGWRFVPQALDLGLAALRLTLGGHEDAGLTALDLLAETMPSNPTIAQLRGQALAGLGRTEAALAAIDQAISLGRRAGYHPDQLQRFENYRTRLIEER